MSVVSKQYVVKVFLLNLMFQLSLKAGNFQAYVDITSCFVLI
jgi:hypothetical protein